MTAPKHEQLADGVDLWLGDATKVVPLLEPVDHTLFDPPYEATIHRAKAKARSGRSLRYDRGPALRSLPFDSVERLRPTLTLPLVELTKGWLLAFCSPEGIAPWRDAIEHAGARYKRACFWDKVNPTPQLNGQGPAFGVEAFVTAWCGSGFSSWNGGGRSNLFSHPVERNQLRETQKPLSLMIELVRAFTQPGDVVFDPCMGTGTTGVAALRTGRRFQGVECDPKAYALARDRLLDALAQPRLLTADLEPVRKQARFDGMPTRRKPK